MSSTAEQNLDISCLIYFTDFCCCLSHTFFLERLVSAQKLRFLKGMQKVSPIVLSVIGDVGECFRGLHSVSDQRAYPLTLLIAQIELISLPGSAFCMLRCYYSLVAVYSSNIVQFKDIHHQYRLQRYFFKPFTFRSFLFRIFLLLISSSHFAKQAMFENESAE